MPDISGPEATRQIVERDPSIRVLALTVSSDDADVSAVLQAGAVGFLSKDTPIDSLVVAVNAAVEWGGVALAESRRGRPRTDPHRGSRRLQEDAAALEQLSEREIDVLRLIANGLENAEIAQELEHQPADREEPRVEHPGEAGAAQPRAGGRLRGPAGRELTGARRRRAQ